MALAYFPPLPLWRAVVIEDDGTMTLYSVVDGATNTREGVDFPLYDLEPMCSTWFRLIFRIDRRLECHGKKGCLCFCKRGKHR